MSQRRTCQLAKIKRHNAKLYTPLSILQAPWKDLSMDFVLSLPTLSIVQAPWKDLSVDFVLSVPKTSRGLDSILVMVDRFSKMAHFIFYSKNDEVSHLAEFAFERLLGCMVFPLPSSVLCMSSS